MDMNTLKWSNVPDYPTYNDFETNQWNFVRLIINWWLKWETRKISTYQKNDRWWIMYELGTDVTHIIWWIYFCFSLIYSQTKVSFEYQHETHFICYKSDPVIQPEVWTWSTPDPDEKNCEEGLISDECHNTIFDALYGADWFVTFCDFSHHFVL